jgi:basic membrane protein A
MFKKARKVLSLGVITVLSISMIGCTNSNQEKEDKVKVTLVLSTGGVNDASFNQSAWEGAKKASEEYGVDVSYLESQTDKDYIQNIETAVDQESDLVVGVGFQMADAIKEAANSYPEQKFAIIDANYDKIPDNVRTITFSEEESGYLVGLIAAKMTKTNVLGWVGGMDIPSCSNFYVGFEKGIKEINPDIKVLKQFTNSFTDAAKGKVIAEQMISSKADIIFTAAGGCNVGALEAVKEKGIKAIGVDMPSNYQAPEHVITSALKNIGEGLKLTIKDFINKDFKGGENIIYDLTNGGVGFEETNLLPKEIIDFVKSKVK